MTNDFYDDIQYSTIATEEINYTDAILVPFL